MKELKLCPFCGHHITYVITSPGKYVQITCNKCGANVRGFNKTAATVKWNSRVSEV